MRPNHTKFAKTTKPFTAARSAMIRVSTKYIHNIFTVYRTKYTIQHDRRKDMSVSCNLRRNDAFKISFHQQLVLIELYHRKSNQHIECANKTCCENRQWFQIHFSQYLSTQYAFSYRHPHHHNFELFFISVTFYMFSTVDFTHFFKISTFSLPGAPSSPTSYLLNLNSYSTCGIFPDITHRHLRPRGLSQRGGKK